MKKLAMLLLLCGVATAKSDRNDGYWWKALSHAEKLVYVQGYVDRAADGVSQLGIEAHLKDAIIVKARRDVVGAGTFGQSMDGLDDFYSDYRNLTIRVGVALIYVNDSIAGAAQEKLQREVEIMRKQAADEESK